MKRCHMFLQSTEGVFADHFAGRLQYRNSFKKFIGEYSSNMPPHHVWVVSGVRAIGKTSFCMWCESHVKNKRPDHWSVVVHIDLLGSEVSRQVLMQKVADELEANGSSRTTLMNLAKKAYSKINEIKTPVANIKLSHENEINIRGLVQWLFDSCERFVIEKIEEVPGKLLQNIDSENPQSNSMTLVLIFDKLSEGNDRSASNLFCELARELARSFSQGGQREFTSMTRIKIALIGATLPGWEQYIHFGCTPRGLDKFKLKPFDLTEVTELVNKEKGLCEFEWNLSHDFVKLLYDFTGGLPQLVQILGWNACENALSHQRTSLGRDDILAASNTHDFRKFAREVLTNNGLNFPSNPSRRVTLSILRAFGSDSVITDSRASKGLLLGEWKNAVQRLSMSDNFDSAFDDVFNFLTASHVLRPLTQKDVFQFCPVILRSLLLEIADEIEESER